MGNPNIKAHFVYCNFVNNLVTPTKILCNLNIKSPSLSVCFNYITSPPYKSINGFFSINWSNYTTVNEFNGYFFKNVYLLLIFWSLSYLTYIV